MDHDLSEWNIHWIEKKLFHRIGLMEKKEFFFLPSHGQILFDLLEILQALFAIPPTFYISPILSVEESTPVYF